MTARPLTWHYTYGHKMAAIQAAGMLLPTAELIAPKERPCLWFSLNQEFEPTALKLIATSTSIHRPPLAWWRKNAQLFRFGLDSKDARLIPWPHVAKKARIPAKAVSHMLAVAVECGARPLDWHGTLEPVPLAALRLEVLTPDGWQAA